MSDLRVTLALCLLGLLAASLAEEMEQVDDAGLKSEARETYQEVMSRQKRHREFAYAGLKNMCVFLREFTTILIG